MDKTVLISKILMNYCSLKKLNKIKKNRNKLSKKKIKILKRASMKKLIKAINKTNSKKIN